MSLSEEILKTLDDAVIRVGASANCYDVPADANSGAEYVAMRVRKVIASAPVQASVPINELEKSAVFVAYNQAIEDAKGAIRAESQGGGYWAATYINAIARRCSPHVYLNQVQASVPAEGVQEIVNQWQAAWVSTQDISRDSESDLVRRIQRLLSNAIQAAAQEVIDIAYRDRGQVPHRDTIAAIFSKRFSAPLAETEDETVL